MRLEKSDNDRCSLCVMMYVYCRYKRYLQSKDLSAVTSEDLDCVLGRKRSRQSSPEVKQVREN